jgi:hypothetical protein
MEASFLHGRMAEQPTMFGKLKNAGPYDRIPLLVILYIAVGMPLVHPLFHPFGEHRHWISGAGDQRLEAPAVEAKDRHCPFCDFAATNQMHAATWDPAVVWNESADDVVPIDSICSPKTCSILIEARAPPCPDQPEISYPTCP